MKTPKDFRITLTPEAKRLAAAVVNDIAEKLGKHEKNKPNRPQSKRRTRGR